MTHHSEDQECKEPLLKSDKLNTDDYVYREYLTSTFGSLVTDNNAVFESRVTTETELEDHGIRYPLYQHNYLRVERVKGQNLKVHELEVTQGLQLQNTIPLVQGRSRVVRAYVDIGAAAGLIANVTGRLRVYSNGHAELSRYGTA